MGKTIAYLHHQWSPEQIASYIPVSLHLIYRCNRKSIHDKSIEIEQRNCFCDLEIDTIVAKEHQQSLGSIVDRKTSYL